MYVDELPPGRLAAQLASDVERAVSVHGTEDDAVAFELAAEHLDPGEQEPYAGIAPGAEALAQ